MSTKPSDDLPDDDDLPPRKPPKFCPWCGGVVKKRWVPNKLLWLSRELGVRVAYVCLTCKVAVRAFKFPSQPMFETKKSARAEAQRAHDELEASGFQSKYVRDLYERGKCSCGTAYQPYLRLTMEPGVVHRPLQRPPS